MMHVESMYHCITDDLLTAKHFHSPRPIFYVQIGKLDFPPGKLFWKSVGEGRPKTVTTDQEVPRLSPSNTTLMEILSKLLQIDIALQSLVSAAADKIGLTT